MTNANKPAKAAGAKAKSSKSFSDVELEAMKAKVAEDKAEKAARRKGAAKPDGEQDILAKIAEMDGSDRQLAETVHAIVRKTAPDLACKTWYGMPAYANADGKIVCFFQSAGKFKVRYATLGFNEAARLDDGNLWPTSYALTALTPADEESIAALVRKAIG